MALFWKDDLTLTEESDLAWQDLQREKAQAGALLIAEALYIHRKVNTEKKWISSPNLINHREEINKLNNVWYINEFWS